MLFDQVIRQDKSPLGYSESLYEYLNRSDRKSSEQIRLLLEDWFSRIPFLFQNELQIRFSSSDNIQHQSAFFELYLHELLLRLGFRIEIHPEIEGKSTHPEFLAILNKTLILYLEGTMAIGPQEDVASDKRKNVIYDTLDRMNSPNFFLEVKINTYSKTPPSGAKWRRILEKKLSELDPDELGVKVEKSGLESLPSWRLKDKEWEVTFRPIPKSPEARGKRGIRPIGITWLDPIWCKEHIYIKNAIKEKATKYGKLNLPYIIAINVKSYFCDDISISDALFGEENITVFRTQNGKSNYKPGRNPNGAWWGPNGPQNTRVSAALIFKYLLWGNIEKETPVLWHNPWASNPLDPNIWLLPQRVPDSKKKHLEKKDGRSARELFDLSPNWAHVDEDNDL